MSCISQNSLGFFFFFSSFFRLFWSLSSITNLRMGTVRYDIKAFYVGPVLNASILRYVSVTRARECFVNEFQIGLNVV